MNFILFKYNLNFFCFGFDNTHLLIIHNMEAMPYLVLNKKKFTMLKLKTNC